MSVAIDFQKVDILFGDDRQKADALPLVDAGKNREEILAETGAVLDQLDMPSGTGVSGLESDGGDRFFCGGGNSGTVRVVRRPRHSSAA